MSVAPHGIWALVPVKAFAAAKQRLAGTLSAPARVALFRCMFEDVLGALAASTRLAGVAIVTRDPQAQDIARAHAALVIGETGTGGGHVGAVTEAVAVLAARAVAGVLVLPADVPGITAAEIDTILSRHGPAPAVTLVPSRDHRGTNAIACSPPQLLRFRYGEDSFRRHLDEARAAGVQPCVLELDGVGLDIDTSADLAEFAGRPSRTRSRAWLVRAGLAAGDGDAARDCTGARIG